MPVPSPTGRSCLRRHLWTVSSAGKWCRSGSRARRRRVRRLQRTAVDRPWKGLMPRWCSLLRKVAFIDTNHQALLARSYWKTLGFLMKVLNICRPDRTEIMSNLRNPWIAVSQLSSSVLNWSRYVFACRWTGGWWSRRWCCCLEKALWFKTKLYQPSTWENEQKIGQHYH